eukprot:Amastigsp_a351652_24.p1 type:complete len:165 gc:universal Amastigsp_a351652_24:134-628(+)
MCARARWCASATSATSARSRGVALSVAASASRTRITAKSAHSSRRTATDARGSSRSTQPRSTCTTRRRRAQPRKEQTFDCAGPLTRRLGSHSLSFERTPSRRGGALRGAPRFRPTVARRVCWTKAAAATTPRLVASGCGGCVEPTCPQPHLSFADSVPAPADRA